MKSVQLLLCLLFHCVRTQDEADVICPCQFAFAEGNVEALECFARIPLITGFKDIEADPSLTSNTAQTGTVELLLDVTCTHVGADVVNLQELQNSSSLPLDAIFYTVPEKTECMFRDSLDEQRLKKDTCENLLNTYDHVFDVLCWKPPVEEQELEECNCPCLFHYDERDVCIRDVSGCAPIGDTSDLVEWCSSVAIAPAVVARVTDATKVPEDFPLYSVFLLGPPQPEENETCGYKTDEGLEQDICDYLLSENELFSAVCSTPELGVDDATVCDAAEEGTGDQQLDAEDCGRSTSVRGQRIFCTLAGLLAFAIGRR